MIKFIKMKKKIIFAVATGFFAVATVFNMNLLSDNKVGDISLESIQIMQKAEAESGYMTCVYASGKCRFPDGFTVPGIKHY